MEDSEYHYSYLAKVGDKGHADGDQIGNGTQAQVVNQGTTTSHGAGDTSAFNRNAGYTASATGANNSQGSL